MNRTRAFAKNAAADHELWRRLSSWHDAAGHHVDPAGLSVTITGILT